MTVLMIFFIIIAVNLMKNGGFEEGPHGLSSSSTGVLLPPRQQDITSPLPGWIIESQKAVKLIESKHFNVPMVLQPSTVAGKDTLKAPFKSEGKGKWKMVSMKFKATSTRTRLSFYSSFYHTRVDDTVSLCGPVIDDVKVVTFSARGI
ncbi:galactose-binding domain-like protein [Tanacetum coccineum]